MRIFVFLLSVVATFIFSMQMVALADGFDGASDLQQNIIKKEQEPHKTVEEIRREVYVRLQDRLLEIGHIVFLDAKKSSLALIPLNDAVDKDNADAPSHYYQTYVDSVSGDGLFGLTSVPLVSDHIPSFGIKGFGLVRIEGRLRDNDFESGMSNVLSADCKYSINIWNGKTYSCEYFLSPQNDNQIAADTEEQIKDEMAAKVKSGN